MKKLNGFERADLLAEAQESYRLANNRVIEVLGEKMAAEQQRDELAAALDSAREEISKFCLYAQDLERRPLILRDLADPSAILAAREKPLRDALDAIVRADEQISDHLTARVKMRGFADHALAIAPEAKP